MTKPKIDGHFHAHFEFVPEIYTPPDSKVLRMFDQIKTEFKPQFNLQKMVCVLAPVFEVANAEIIKDDFVYPGIYVHVQDDYKSIIENAKQQGYQFIQFHSLDSPASIFITKATDYKERLAEIIDYSLGKGFRKFQIHTHGFNHSDFEFVRKYAKGDTVIYLAAGLESIYWSKKYDESKLDLKELKKLEGNLLLGTRSFGDMIEIPHPHLKQALDDGLENLICFESCFVLNHMNIQHPSHFYSGSIECIEDAVGNNTKIFRENIKLFLD